MRLDKTVEAQPFRTSFFMLVGVLGGTLLPMVFRPLLDWRAGTMLTCVTLLDCVGDRQSHRGAWVFLDVAFITGGFVFDHLYREPSPVVSPFIFAMAFFVVVGALQLFRWTRTPSSGGR
jgi:hypothetical protein